MPNRKQPVDERRTDRKCEYIFELCTKRSRLFSQKLFPVGCNGSCIRYRARVSRNNHTWNPTYLKRQAV